MKLIRKLLSATPAISATVKTFYRENGHFRLQPENRTMKPIIVDEVYILGKVVADLRFY